MGQIICKCGRWCILEKDCRFCVACGSRLFVEDLGDLPELSEQASGAYVAVRVSAQSGGRTGMLSGFALAFLLMQGGFVDEFWGLIIMISSCVAGILLGRWKRSEMLKAIAVKYERIWSMPRTFRPSVYKDVLTK